MSTSNEQLVHLDEYTEDPYLSSVFEDEADKRASIAFKHFGGLIIHKPLPKLVEWIDQEGNLKREIQPQLVASLHFGPFGNLEADTSKRSQILLQGFLGIREYIDKVESGEIEKPFALRGVTNMVMGRAVQRLGFKKITTVQKLY